MSDEEAPTTMHHRAGDPPIKVTREIPLPWLVGVIIGLIVQAVSVWIGVQSQGDAIKSLTAEIKELRASVAAGGLQAVRIEVRVEDHERRLQQLERVTAK